MVGGCPIPERWTAPWRGIVATSLSGCSELSLDSLVDRTMAVAQRIESDA